MASYQSYIFLNEWQGGDEETLKQAFGIGERELAGVRILLASYVRDAFYGEAFILFRRGERLYEVNATHDSVVGAMRGQWEPEETLIDALRYRLEKGRLGTGPGGVNLFADELRFLLAELETR